MRGYRFLTGVLLVISLVLMPGFSAAAEGTVSIEVGESVGTLENSVIGTGLSMFFDAGIVVDTSDGKKAVLDPFGENLLGKTYDDVDSFGDAREYFVVTDLSRLPNALSLVKADGTVLFEDAAMIDTLSFSMFSTDRYVKASIASKVTESEEECFLFSYAPTTAIDIRLEPGEGDTMYTGYMRIFDLWEGCFVENVMIDNADDDIYLVGDNLLIDYQEYERDDELYSPSGEMIGTVKGTDKNRNCFISRAEDKNYSVLDSDLNEIALLDFYPSRVYAGGELFAKPSDDNSGYLIVNSEGEAICDALFRYVPNEEMNFLIGEDETGNCAVVSRSGDLIISFEDNVKSVYERVFGYFDVRYQDDTFSVLAPDGTLTPLKYSLTTDLLSYSNQDEQHEIYILNDKSYHSTEGLIYSVDRLLYSVRSQNGNHGLYSAVDGSLLIEPEYKNYTYSNGYIYAQADDHFDIYRCLIG